jgi:membrane fusion protein, multidrug efflux system
MNNRYLIFAIPILLAAGCSGSGDHSTDKKTDPVVARPHYQTAVVVAGGAEQVVKLPATLAAFLQVSIFPKVNGYVTDVRVDVGSHVQKGQLLMTLEAPELVQAVAQAKERYARALADYRIDRENYERLAEASRTPGAISPMDLATDKAKAEADSALANSEKANWQMQQAMMDYLHVTAPFAGVITIRNVHPGALVDATNKSIPLLELKQVDHLRLQVDIPETIAATLRKNDTLSFYVVALPGRKLTAPIARISDNINMQYRTERVEADIYNSDETLSPGMYADVVFDSKGNRGALAVPPSAVVISTEAKYVIAVRNGRTVKVNVTTGNENSRLVEVVGDLRAGDTLIAPANDEIKEGVAFQ